MPSIYILSDLKFSGVINIPLLEIKYFHKKVNFNDYDALIFTSKNAVYSLSSFDDTWKNIPAYAIAQKTAEVIEKEGGVVGFIGTSSTGNDFAKELSELLQNKKVLYIRAKKVASSLSEVLKNKNINIDELISYKTQCKKDLPKIKIEDKSIIIFSSPSTIKCFFNQYLWNKSLIAIVIGKTTASFMPENIDFRISPSTSLKKCIEVAKSI